MEYEVIKNGIPAEIIVEDSSFDGVFKIASVLGDDLESICDKRPYIGSGLFECLSERVIICATLGRSGILDKLIDSNVDINVIKDKREVFLMTAVDISLIDADRSGQALIIAGSDKRGTIYGILALSSFCGVTSLVYFGDSEPVKNTDIMLTDDVILKDRSILTRGDNIFVSKEPSIIYRGFFINDEWPAFGKWCNEHFGGFTAACYEKLFIFLLRMRGNFLWPAMWSSVFSEDGPGIESAKLADCLGIIMGTSHHEPLCRAGEEWQHIYKEYGDSNAWNFISNKDAITKFWKDGLMRNRRFENLITIGMRGEADSKLLSEDATMADNIKVVKDAILTQHKLIKECINEDIAKVPRVLAIYKEVEDYYYGDETCEGLKDWDELKDVIFLLSDDNWANTRGLPKEDERRHPGGFGMYYHFDYHGGPISYEWQNTSRLTKTWEQMTQAYEYGVRKQWIVNVGDLKGNEYPLTYFMDLAYDYETWSREDMIDTYMDEWIDKHFHSMIEGENKQKLLQLIEGVTKWNALRKPEGLNSAVYDPVNFSEADRVLNEAKELSALADELRENLPENCIQAYESIFYYQFRASLNILMMQLEAGINAYLAQNRILMANTYAESVKRKAELMGTYISEYNEMLSGKWRHMLESGHTGLRTWDDYDWGYPVSVYVNPIHKGKIAVYFEGEKVQSLGAHWQFGRVITNRSMLLPDKDSVRIVIDSRGDVDFDYEAVCDNPQITLKNDTGRVVISQSPRAIIEVDCDKSALNEKIQAQITLKVGFDDKETTEVTLRVLASPIPDLSKVSGAFIEHEGIISMRAEHFCGRVPVKENEGYKVIKYLGREGNAVKCYPVTKDYRNTKDTPKLTYDVIASTSGVYNIEVDMLARNPVIPGDDMILYVSSNDGEKIELNGVNKDFYAGHTCPQWCEGVLDNVRRLTSKVELKAGLNTINVFAGSPNVSFDKIILWREGIVLPHSYLGPKESFRA